jgi:hypothetical protein
VVTALEKLLLGMYLHLSLDRILHLRL